MCASLGGHLRLQGTVEILSSGSLFDRCIAQSPGYTVRHAIVVTVKEVMDLDAQTDLMGNVD